MNSDWIAIGSVIAWGGLWLHFCVSRFFSKPEDLHQDYIHNGVLDLALSYVESERIIPALARIFDKARESDQSVPTEQSSVDLFQQVDYIDDLDSLETALDAKRTLKDRFTELKRRARRLWKVGLAHILAVAATAGVYLFLGSLFMAIVLGTLSVAAFLWMVYDLIQYERHQTKFLNALQEYRTDGQTV